MTETVEISVELIEALLAEMRGLRADIARQNPSAFGNLAGPLAAEMGDGLFTAAEVVRRSKSHGGAIADALAASLRSVSARCLGRHLARCEGQPDAGFCVRRVGVESGGVIWRVEAVVE